MKLLFLDTETHALDNHALDNPEIVQLSWVRVIDNYATRRTSLYKPKTPITPGASAVHHITNEMVRDAQPFDAHAIESVNEALSGVIMVAHNAPFDIDVLTRAGCKAPEYVIDTLKVAYALWDDLEQYKLQYLRYHLGIEAGARAHDAEGDVEVLIEVFNHMLDKWRKQHTCDDKTAIQAMVLCSRSPIIYRKFPFGKYKGRVIADIVKEDRSYCQWLLKCCDENMEYTLRSLM